jgi:hypothetical protein
MQLSRWSSPFALLALATAFLSFSAVAANDPRLKSLGRDACDGGCNACEGDCDVDSDCDGNLKCFQRGRKESVPGCSKKGRRGENSKLNTFERHPLRVMLSCSFRYSSSAMMGPREF